MKRALILIVVVIFTAVLSAKNASRNRLGILLRMESVPCSAAEANGFGKVLFGAPTPAPVPEERLCQEYVLLSEGLYYRIRSKSRKHPVLLPIGEQAQFRLHRDRMLVQVEDFDSKPYEFSVLAIVPENHGGRFMQQSVEKKDLSEPLQETLQ